MLNISKMYDECKMYVK